MNFNLSLAEKLEKIRSRKFGIDDLSNYLKNKMKPGAVVVPLQEKKWVKVGMYWLYLKYLYIGMEDSLIDVLVVKDAGLFNSALFVWAMFFGKTISAVEWNLISGTNLVFETWFVGDGVHRVTLVTEVVKA